MKCSHARQQFSAWIDRDLTFEEEAGLRDHLGGCPDCRDEFDRLQQVHALLRDLPETDPGPGFYEGVRAMIAAHTDAPEEAAPSLGERLRALLAPAWLRPAVGAAFGLALGLIIGGSGGFGGAGAPSGTLGPAAEMAVVDSGPGAGLEGPLADLPLPAVRVGADSLLEGGEEYILDPYLADPQRGLVTPSGGRLRTVAGEQRDAQDVYITF